MQPVRPLLGTAHPDQPQLGLEDLEQTVASAKAVQETTAARGGAPRAARACRRNLALLGEERAQPFLAVLEKVADANNASSRVPLQESPAEP